MNIAFHLRTYTSAESLPKVLAPQGTQTRGVVQQRLEPVDIVVFYDLSIYLSISLYYTYVLYILFYLHICI